MPAQITLFKAEPAFFSTEQEQNIVGILLVNNSVLAKAPGLKAEHFGDPVHARIAELIFKSINGGQIASPVMIGMRMSGDEGLAQLGGGAYLARLAAASINAKALAMRDNVPVTALAQLNRGVEERDDKRPALADFWSPVQVEQDADLIIFPYRAEYYLAMRKPTDGGDSAEIAAWHKGIAAAHGHIELIVAKNRNGTEGTAPVRLAAAYNHMHETAQAALAVGLEGSG